MCSVFAQILRLKITFLEEWNFCRGGGVLDTPLAKSQDILKAFFEKVDTDILVLAHVTSPFIKKETVEKCIEAVKSGEYDSAFSAGRVCDLLWKDGKPYNFDATNIVRTQDLPLIYRESCGVYVFTKEMFKETNRRIGFKPYICEISEIESIDVDYPEDFLIADAVYTKIIKK